MGQSAMDSAAGCCGTVRRPGGVSLGYREFGAATAPTLLLLHGYTDSWHSFARVLEPLSRRFHVIALDQRGHGTSDQPVGRYAMHDLADDAIACLDALTVARAIVIGHSMGSFVAQHVAARCPQRVHGLVLIGSADVAGNAVVRELADVVESLSDPVPEEFVREFQLSTVHRPVPDDFIEMAIETSRRMPARLWKALIAAMLAERGGLGPAIDVPTLLIWGDQDAIFSRTEQDELLASIRDSRLEVLADTGHAPHWEEPDRFVRAIDLFADQLTHRSAVSHQVSILA